LSSSRAIALGALLAACSRGSSRRAPQPTAVQPGAPGADGVCDPADWSLVAPNAGGDAQLTQFDDPASSAITLLAATSTHLYVGFNNAGGVGVFRSALTAPALRSDFVRVGPPGLGLSATRIFDGKALVFSGSASVYATVGDGTSPARLVRFVE
jgi:hypothetical protein